ncbi:hypothetical protein AB6A40_009117 [Gnathostoma spinigerum]|uniref:RING-type domain-containing protein n=1 Tax=Gnathostoma spinigerum TaxID=75299 RepID=A0ABD6EZ84_9BILA
MSGSTEVVFPCRVCRRVLPVEEMEQIVPCLHIFCKQCISRSKPYDKICPALHCYSIAKQSVYQKFGFGGCDVEICPRKYCYFEATRLPACQHEICFSCLEEAKRRCPPVCPVESCHEPFNETTDEGEVCDGPCKQALTDGKFTVLKCCGACLCNICFEKTFGTAPTPDAEMRCPKQCILKKPRQGKDEKDSVPIAKCQGKDDCDQAALNGFPSQKECDHEVCIRCLQKMIEDCIATGSMPMCPNDLCRAPYCVESVIALRALFPSKSDYFSQLALENQGYDAIKDEAVTLVEYYPDFNAADQLLEVKVIADETTATVLYDKKGSIADFIRELRRELKILPLDKVYGYYIRREDDKSKDTDEKKPDEELIINGESLTKRMDELNLTPECQIVVDLSGIVQAKSVK